MLKSLQLCPTLCDPMDCSLPGSSVQGILQARTLGWVAIPPPGDPPDPGIKPVPHMSPALAGWFFTPTPPGKSKRSFTQSQNAFEIPLSLTP